MNQVPKEPLEGEAISLMARLEESYKAKYLALVAAAQRVALENTRLHNEVEVWKGKAFRDPLTQLLNRDGFYEVVKYSISEIERAEIDRGLGTYSVVHIDIDNFKLINDRFGHDGGDAVVKEFSQLLTRTIRGGDAVARWGGDEFLIFLPNTPLAGAFSIAEKLCEKARRLSVRTRKGLIEGITLSIGVAELKEREDINRTIARADDALYQVKESGRDGVSSL